jgi:cell division protein FtsB
VARRRRVFLLLVGVALLILAGLANYAPLHSYFDARARLDKANAGVAELTAQKDELQTELGRLSEADYLESLARQDLSYTRPGEELYIVTSADTGVAVTTVTGGTTLQNGATNPAGGTASSGTPGLVERVLTPILD